MIRCFFFI